jgi:hypothetical protein
MPIDFYNLQRDLEFHLQVSPFRRKSVFVCSMTEAASIHLPCAGNFLYASSLDKPYYYGNNGKNKQNMNDASCVKREKP